MKPYAYSSAAYFTQNAMTTVLISHNPFRIETHILIDGKAITDTSSLFKYLLTPMQYWVSDFLPSLIADCNDDELEITFKGLPYNYEDLKSELDQFLQKNMDYDIELLFDACEDQTARLNTLETTLSELKTQTVVEELNCQEFVSSSAGNHLEVLVLGGSNPQQAVLINGLFGTGLYNSQSEFQRILLNIDSRSVPAASALPLNPESIAETIRSADMPVVIYILNDQLKRSKTGFPETIAEQYRIRGKQNKQRFLFVAETPAAAIRSLSSEFGIKNASVYAFDEITLIQRQIEKYHSEVSLIRYLTVQCDNITQQLNLLEEALSAKAIEHKDTQNINQLETRALTLLGNCELVTPVPNTSGITDLIMDKLCSEFGRLKSSIIENSRLNVFYFKPKPNFNPKRTIETFVDSIPTKIEEKLKTVNDTANRFPIHVNIPKDLYPVLTELECFNTTTLLQELKEKVKESSTHSPDIAQCIDKIQAIIFTQTPNIYPGLSGLCCNCFHNDNTFTEVELEICYGVFQKNIEKIRPILNSYMETLYTSSQDICIHIYNQALKKIEQTIHEQAQNLRNEAKISSDALVRLQYIQGMKERIVGLTRLGGETSNG